MDTLIPENPWQSVDPLGEALHSLRMSGTFYARSDLTAPWGVDLPPIPDSLMFHVITAGSCWAEFEGGARHHLVAGDFALIPHGRGHLLMDEPGSPTPSIFDLPRVQVSPRYELLDYGGGGAKTQLICGAVSVKDPAARRVVDLLPEIIVMQANTPENEWLLGSIRMMMKEAEHLQPGGDTIITRVSDILVVQAIRHWLATDPLAKTGWLGALHDAQIGRAIALVPRNPTEPWTVESMAEGAGMSRSAFAARFMALVDEPPMQYVRKWRFAVADNWLREGSKPTSEIAFDLGYQSEAAFCRAFKKFTGTTPGAVRRQARAAEAA